MQGNGFKIFAASAFIVLSLYYLFPTFQHYLNEKDLESMDDEAAEQYRSEHFASLQSTREKALKLGLDLQGGMHVTLEVGVDALVRELAEGRRDEVFDSALLAARGQAETSRSSFVDLFIDEIERQQPGTRLSRYFRDTAEGISARSENGDVKAYLDAEASGALTRAMEIIRQRVDRFGVSEPSIQMQGNSRIVVELPGVDDPKRVRELLKGTARLDFRLMADPQELQSAALQVVQYFAELDEDLPTDTTASDSEPGTGPETGPDSTAVDTEAPEIAAASADSTADTTTTDTVITDVESLFTDIGGGESDSESNRFSEIFRLYPSDLPIFGLVAASDTAEVQRYLGDPAVQAMIPPGIILLYDVRTDQATEEGEPLHRLLGVRSRVEMTGDVLTDARTTFDPITNEPKVSLSMNSEGSSRWSQITGANVGKNVAIVLDNVVFTWPNIIERIPSGRTEISGVTRTEAEDVVTVLKSGALPAPVRIIEERTVGPSLGAKSIKAGTISVVAGLTLVLLFMIFYYRTAGLVADLALLLNLLFIFGILAAFGAVLTLPGIAGIVLTIGMAVDANVLIFERIREEIDTGKTLKASIDGGYKKAISAIADANITTFFVGVILYSFGVGPIQGFAVTLMAGILSSLFTAILVTRLVFDWFVADRRRSVAFG